MRRLRPRNASTAAKNLSSPSKCWTQKTVAPSACSYASAGTKRGSPNERKAAQLAASFYIVGKRDVIQVAAKSAFLTSPGQARRALTERRPPHIAASFVRREKLPLFPDIVSIFNCSLIMLQSWNGGLARTSQQVGSHRRRPPWLGRLPLQANPVLTGWLSGSKVLLLFPQYVISSHRKFAQIVRRG